MKKIIILLLTTLLLTGCTIVRIDTSSIDNTINVVLSKNNHLYNRIGKGYKYYIPRGVTYIDTTEFNDKLYSNGSNYYLYVDAISYYYGVKKEYQERKDIYYSRKININDLEGYLEIEEINNQYLVRFEYNYARIEALVDKDKINDAVLNASYILSTVKFNYNVIKIMLDEQFFINKEEKYDIFESTEENDKFLEIVDEEQS